MVVHQLQHVFVAGNDINGVAPGDRLLSKRADDIVGLIALLFEDGDAVCIQRAAYVGQLLHQVPGHLGTIGLIAGVFDFLELLGLDIELADGSDRFSLLIAKGGRSHVEYSSQKLR